MKYNYKPSLAELRSSLKYRSKEYFLENTLHGVSYFMDPTRPKWERVMWFLLTSASVVAIIAIIVVIWDKLQTEPTITGLDLQRDHLKIDFPKLFICFDWDQLNHPSLPKNEMHVYEQVYNWTWGKTIDLESLKAVYGSKNNFRSIFKKMAPSCSDLITNCAYKNVKKPCDEYFTKVLVTVGACCKLEALEPFVITDVAWYLQFEVLSSTWRLYLIEPWALFPLPGERPLTTAYSSVNVEFVARITYTTPEIRQLLFHQRECYFEHEGAYLNECEIKCISDQVFEKCNCLPWFLSPTDKVECSLSRYSCLTTYNLDLTRCDCLLPCNFTTCVIHSVTNAPNNISKILMKKWAGLYKRQLQFGVLDLIVSFGGIASLYIGYSLLSSVELGYYFTLKTYCGAVIQSSRKQCNIMKIHVVEKNPPKVDVNPRYYQYIE